ncbi:aminotransferase class V-fold PLP-dependent enzyme [Porticoccus sp.]
MTRRSASRPETGFANDRGANILAARGDFPVLDQVVGGKPLVYLDNAATTQKPRQVIERLCQYYERDNANVHRGVHELSERATWQYEQARELVRDFINAAEHEEVIFVRGTTEAINLVAQSYLRPRLVAGDEILITEMEHHSNIVPWQLVAAQTGAKLRVVPITDEGELVIDAFANMMSERTRLVAVSHVSNTLGTVNPVAEIVRICHHYGVPVLVDGAQAVGHMPVDMRAIGCDFYAFSGHKMYAPTGIGVLYGRRAILNGMPPWQGGGEMIRKVSFEHTDYADLPSRFEAGTPDIAGAIGLGAAIDYINGLGRENIAAREQELLALATEALQGQPGLEIIGRAPHKGAILSFVLQGVHPHDISTILDREGVAVRAGHHCTMPLMERLGIPGTTRASFAFYNRDEDVAALLRGLHEVREFFK